MTASTSPAFPRTRAVLDAAVARRVAPAAVIEVGSSQRWNWREALGHLTYGAHAPATSVDTIFDLASLTKVLATTALVMRHVERGSLSLDDAAHRLVPGWAGADRADVRISDLLAHASGLPAYAPLYQTVRGGRDAIVATISAMPLSYPPRSKSIYSDLGFLVLGRALESFGPLDQQFQSLTQQLGPIQDLQYLPPQAWLGRTAPTQYSDWRNRLLVGEVDDENAAALGGVAPHAGLFGTAGSVGEYARHLLQVLDDRRGVFRRETVELFTARWLAVPDSSRALGWDTMRPTSSCGTRLSSRAFGHTGFAGTSLWIDPEQDLYVVLLTNRVHPKAAVPDAIKALRRAVHDAVVDDLSAGI